LSGTTLQLIGMPDAARPLALLDRVRRLFADRRTQARCAERSPSAPPPTVKSALSVSGARFSLVGLSELREQLGERWPELSHRVHELAEAVIRRHLTRGDVFDARGEDGYVILFTQLTQLQAEFKCRVIAKEIAAKLLGADWVGRTTDGVVFELPEAALAAPSFEKALHEAIAKGRPVRADMPTPQAPHIEQRDDSVALAAGSRSLAHALKPIERDRGRTAYTPIWEFGAEAILRFRFRPDALEADAPTSEIAKADIAALTQVLFDVGRLATVGRRLPVICPLQFETVIRDVWRAQVIRMLRAAPAPVRRLVALEVMIGPDEADWIGSLERAWSSMPGALRAAVPLQASASPARRSAVVRHLNLALADNFSASKSGIELLGAFVQKAERAGFTCGVMGLRTRAAALAASAAGFRQLSGPAIHRDVAALGQATHFDLRTLYRDLLPRTA
jgi:hypothetical protein